MGKEKLSIDDVYERHLDLSHALPRTYSYAGIVKLKLAGFNPAEIDTLINYPTASVSPASSDLMAP